jgi:hypothetical protein
MFDDQAVAEGGSADEVDLSAQQYAIGPHGYLQNSFLAPEYTESSDPPSNGEPPAGGNPPSPRDESFVQDEEDEDEDLDEGGKEEEEDEVHPLPKNPLYDEMPERNRQDLSMQWERFPSSPKGSVCTMRSALTTTSPLWWWALPQDPNCEATLLKFRLSIVSFSSLHISYLGMMAR